MSTKEQQIQEFLSQPIKKGDWATVTVTSYGKTNQKYVQIDSADDENVYYKEHGYNNLQSCPLANVERCVRHIGVNPFKPELRATAYQIDTEQLFWRCGFDRREKEERTEKYFGVRVPETCLNPMVIDEQGNEVEYQRGLVWTLEQKQLLIESIYNNVEIGKFVLRKRSFGWVEKRVKAGKIEHTAFSDLVDGKQRFTTLVSFFQNEFPDMHGNYFSDLSESAQRKFFGYRQLTYLELDENSTDKDALAVFLAINFTGVPMSKEHIEYVKSIKV
jgi:hypothetical protein